MAGEQSGLINTAFKAVEGFWPALLLGIIPVLLAWVWMRREEKESDQDEPGAGTKAGPDAAVLKGESSYSSEACENENDQKVVNISVAETDHPLKNEIDLLETVKTSAISDFQEPIHQQERIPTLGEVDSCATLSSQKKDGIDLLETKMSSISNFQESMCKQEPVWRDRDSGAVVSNQMGLLTAGEDYDDSVPEQVSLVDEMLLQPSNESAVLCASEKTDPCCINAIFRSNSLKQLEVCNTTETMQTNLAPNFNKNETESDVKVDHKDVQSSLEELESDGRGIPCSEPIVNFVANFNSAEESEAQRHSIHHGDKEMAKEENDGDLDGTGLQVDPKSKQVLAVPPMPQNVNVTFQVHYITTSDAQLIAVTGNHEALGDWENFLLLKPNKDGFWSDSVLLPMNTRIEWKFVVVENGKIQRWEECCNRCLETSHEDIKAHQWWGC
ncbi:uncharacterized protein STBD1 [Latimeria chalumnae]|uniref:uncharacterized protein STBD1 n=1 Tax=Latimeria chalumnae TaxID=7897 RepID=UPI0003C1B1C9|nr:PREDICTED: starch-binding domain-containing protein 1 isoform X1 [Latimeria chalumnae]|eukprot:XP_006010883.1 PREDICTED: starch-binding domain-containing protein 1 isoform X1 [Latimeria chalumnae]